MVVRASAVRNAGIVRLGRVYDVCTRFAAEDLEWKMFGVSLCSNRVSRWYSVQRRRRQRRRFGLAELVSVDVPCSPPAFL